MQCPQCQNDNPAEAVFCEECGSRLEVACPSCGEIVRLGVKFCKKCGQSLTQTNGAGPAAQPKFASPETYTPKYLAERILTSKAALEGERKQVTVLFADLKGSMELLADRDPEEARALLDAVLNRMMEAVHRYEGTVNQVMGDGIMALFGAPLALEDHALRACYAALALQNAIREYAEEALRTLGIKVQARVGLNSGEVVVRTIGSDLKMDYTAVGHTTNLAARMEQLADPGSIYLTADTLRLAEGFVQVEPLGPVPIKGMSEAVVVYELKGATSGRTRFQATAAGGLTHFVGRTSELEDLQAVLQKASERHGQVFATVAEAGVGKSRLYWEFTRSHRTKGWMLNESGSVSYGKATAYKPVIDLLKAYFGVEDADDHRRIREKVTGKILTLDESLTSTIPPVLSILEVPVEDEGWKNLDPPQRRQRTLDGVKHLLLREAQVQPLVVVFEDLHWIDSETQALLDLLIESLPGAPVLLLVNYRPEYEHGWANKTYYTRLHLDPLSTEGAEELLQVILGEDPALDTLKKLLIERTEGIPLFLEECVRTLAETGVLAGGAGAYRLVKEISEARVPATVHTIIASRMDRLSPDEKRLLQTASVIGTHVPFPLLRVVAEMPEEALHQGLASLQAAEFLYETALFPEREFRFKHALTHEVAYGSLVQERKRTLHAAIVEAIEEGAGDRLDEHVESLAHHAFEGEAWEKAIGYCRQAGEKAAARSAHQEAIANFTKGLEVIQRIPESPEKTHQEISFHLGLGVQLMTTKGYGSSEAGQSFARAKELCDQLEDSPELFSVLWGLARNSLIRSRVKESYDLGEQLLAIAQRLEDPERLLEAHFALVGSTFWLGNMNRARLHGERGFTFYNSEEHQKLTSRIGHNLGEACLLYLGQALWFLGYPDQGLEKINQALASAEAISHPASIARALHFAVRLELYR